MYDTKNITIFKKGTEEIYYNFIQGDIYVHYYLLCKFDNERVTKSYSFAYSPCIDIYFSMEDYDRLNNIIDFKKANNYIVSTKPASVDNIKYLNEIMNDEEFIYLWKLYHRSEYGHIYGYEESDEENNIEDEEQFVWKHID